MTTVTIPLDANPNQNISFVINGSRWHIRLFTRLGQLFASVENDKDGVQVQNRVCLNGTPITKNLVFIDTHGDDNPTYTGLNGQFVLVYTDEA